MVYRITYVASLPNWVGKKLNGLYPICFIASFLQHPFYCNPDYETSMKYVFLVIFLKHCSLTCRKGKHSFLQICCNTYVKIMWKKPYLYTEDLLTTSPTLTAQRLIRVPWIQKPLDQYLFDAVRYLFWFINAELLLFFICLQQNDWYNS